MRLQKYMALCGVASRRKSEQLIAEGKVKVNGMVVREMGIKIETKDVVEFDGKIISPETTKHYILFNKPEGVITTASDEFDRKTVMDYFDGVEERIYPVGRLDYDSSGLIILTNDGEFANFMMHPSNHIGKTYLISCSGEPDEKDINRLRTGVEIDGYMTHQARVTRYSGHGKWTLKITIYEGRNRQVRKMIEAVGSRVHALRRIGIGNIHDSGLEPGAWRNLTAKELRDLGYETS